MTANVVKLGQIATIDISNVDKKSKVGEAEVRLCNFVDVYHNWAITDNISQGFMVATANENQVVLNYRLTAVDNPGGTKQFSGKVVIIRQANGWKIDQMENH